MSQHKDELPGERCDAEFAAIWRALPWPVCHAFGGDEREGAEGIRHMLARGEAGERAVREHIERSIGLRPRRITPVADSRGSGAR